MDRVRLVLDTSRRKDCNEIDTVELVGPDAKKMLAYMGKPSDTWDL